MVGAVVVRGQALAHQTMVGPVVGPGTDVAGAEAEPGGRHGLLHGGPVEQHRAVAGEAAVQFVSGALQCNPVSGGGCCSVENQCNFPLKLYKCRTEVQSTEQVK